jgi:UDP-GlcNAc:undecaprenyl-phosphate GlcNAc-1-phosphate transferase
MGDGGSLMLGALLVMVWHDGGLGAVVLGSAVPLLEAGFVTVRRIASRRPPWVGGTDHTGHVLLRAGIPSSVLPLVYAAVAAGAVAMGGGP